MIKYTITVYIGSFLLCVIGETPYSTGNRTIHQIFNIQWREYIANVLTAWMCCCSIEIHTREKFLFLRLVFSFSRSPDIFLISSILLNWLTFDINHFSSYCYCSLLFCEIECWWKQTEYTIIILCLCVCVCGVQYWFDYLLRWPVFFIFTLSCCILYSWDVYGHTTKQKTR